LVRERLTGARRWWVWLITDGVDRGDGWSGVGFRDVDHALMHNHVHDFNLAEIEGIDNSRHVIPMFGALESNRVRSMAEDVASETTKG